MAENVKRGREWLPQDWCDECCPPMKASPDDFIVIDPDGALRLGYAADDGDATDHDREIWNKPLKEGDIVKFYACDRLVEVDATFNEDGSYTIEGEIPAEHNQVWVPFDSDTMCESFDEFHRMIKSGELELPIGESMTLQFNRWSDSIPHRLVVVDAQPRFEQVSAVTANN